MMNGRMRMAAMAAVLVAMLAWAPLASALSVAGTWSGTLTVNGKAYSATVTFGSGGSFRASAGGHSTSGSYSISGGGVYMSAMGFGSGLTVEKNGDVYSMYGSGKTGGLKGSLSLSRRVKGGSSASPEERFEAKDSIYKEWALEQGGETALLRIYPSGWLMYLVVPSGGEADWNQAFFAKLEERKGVLTLTPVSYEWVARAPERLNEYFDAEKGVWTLSYKLEDGTLTLASGDAFQKRAALEAQPTELLLRPYVEMKRGDRGECVQLLQQALIDLGILADKADGIFGRKTEAAVKQFKAERALKADGQADEAMLRALYGL